MCVFFIFVCVYCMLTYMYMYAYANPCMACAHMHDCKLCEYVRMHQFMCVCARKCMYVSMYA